MEIIACINTSKLGSKTTLTTFRTKTIIKREEYKFKEKGEIIIIRKTLETNICDGKII